MAQGRWCVRAEDGMNPSGHVSLGYAWRHPLPDESMTPRRATQTQLFDRVCSPSEFLVQGWLSAVMILGAIVILLIAILAMG